MRVGSRNLDAKFEIRNPTCWSWWDPEATSGVLLELSLSEAVELGLLIDDLVPCGARNV